MGKIYTRGGDKGLTSIHGGERVEKDDIRIEANGTLDELNSLLGAVRGELRYYGVKGKEQSSIENYHIKEQVEKIEKVDEIEEMELFLREIQVQIMVIMSLVATPGAKRDENPNMLKENIVEQIENYIDKIRERLQESNFFILPFGDRVSSNLHIARTVARRAERRLCSLNKIDKVPSNILQFINRLSDLLFVMARYNMQLKGLEEDKWKSFGYKRGGGNER